MYLNTPQCSFIPSQTPPIFEAVDNAPKINLPPVQAHTYGGGKKRLNVLPTSSPINQTAVSSKVSIGSPCKRHSQSTYICRGSSGKDAKGKRHSKNRCVGGTQQWCHAEAAHAPPFLAWHLDTTKAFKQLSLKVQATSQKQLLFMCVGDGQEVGWGKLTTAIQICIIFYALAFKD